FEKRLEGLAARVEAELKASNMRFEAATNAFNYAFNVLIVLGGVGSFLGGTVILLSWLRNQRLDERHRQDYRRERDFYETQVLNVERRQEASAQRELSLECSSLAWVQIY